MAWAPRSARLRNFRSTITRSIHGLNLAFDFQDDLEALGRLAPSVSEHQQDEFIELFIEEIEKLEQWCVESHWPRAAAVSHPNVHVSGSYRIARSLVLHWEGQPGLMEFPASRVTAGEAPIMHELVHVYFPNSNRLLAEGLSVWLQQEIGGTLAYPNFGIDLDKILRDEFGDALKEIRIEQLDRISTPTNLLMRLGRTTMQESFTYIVAGSFIRFLANEFALGAFRSLFALTPLIPFQRNSGSPGRWEEIYGATLPELQKVWLSQMLAPQKTSASRKKIAVLGKRHSPDL